MKEDASIKIEIDQDSPLWAGAPFAEDAARRVTAAALAHGSVTCLDGAELSVLLTDDARIRALNAAWRGQDKATNVLSFPAVEPTLIATAPLLGDIVVSYETVELEARARLISFRNHYVHLLLHGFLHLFGHDHLTDVEAAAMERLESEILHRLGIADPYVGASTTREAS